MKLHALAVPALIMLVACGDTLLAPVQPQDAAPTSAAPRSGDSWSGLPTGPVETTVIDFESLADSGNSVTTMASYSEDGFTLVDPADTASTAFSSPQVGSWLYEGSTSLLNNYGNHVTKLTKDDGGTFTVASIDIGELMPSSPDAVEVTFTGVRANGSTVTQTFTTDGVLGFQTFAFDGFKDLVALTWVQAAPYHQFDNITLDPVPLAPQTKPDCWDGGWKRFGFKNQGQCLRMVETGKDSRG